LSEMEETVKTCIKNGSGSFLLILRKDRPKMYDLLGRIAPPYKVGE